MNVSKIMKKRTFSIGGIHVPEMKEKIMGEEILQMPLPATVVLPLRQHIGAPAVPVVAKGDHVTIGQKVADAQGKVSAPIHAPISGVIADIGMYPVTSGMSDMAIVIKADETVAADTTPNQKYDDSALTPAEIVAAIADAGIVGMGGATFPTAVKLSPPPGCKAEVLLINGAECEPCLTCDNVLMLHHSDEVMHGVDLLRRAAGVDRAIIGIEDNKPAAIAAMTKAAEAYPAIEVQPLITKYPQGSEKQLIYALTGREVASGALPISVGAIVQNVGTAFAVYEAIVLHRPLISRIITIGNIVNCQVALGTSLQQVIDFVKEKTGHQTPNEGEWDVVIGGPMMGRSATTLDAPVIKGTSGVTYYTPLPYDPQPCIRCGACVDACPMGLEPYLLANYGRRGLLEEAASRAALDCVECGSCSYSCPSARPILDYIRLAKAGIRNLKK